MAAQKHTINLLKEAKFHLLQKSIILRSQFN